MSYGNESSPEFAPDRALTSTERRAKLRLTGPFAARARIVERGGISKIDSTVENISASGLYLRLDREVEQGTVLFVLTQFSTAWKRKARAAWVATRGFVVRVESKPEGGYGVAVTITRHRFL